MNARIYDPLLGRFMSADPFIHRPTMTQSWNRYAHVYNNPLTYTDSTGYSPDGGDDGPGAVSGYGGDSGDGTGYGFSDPDSEGAEEARRRGERLREEAAARAEAERKAKEEADEAKQKAEEDARRKAEEDARKAEEAKQKRADEEAKLKAEVEAIINKVKNNPLNDPDFNDVINNSDFHITSNLPGGVLGLNTDVLDNPNHHRDNDISIATDPHDINGNGKIDPGAETKEVVDTIVHEVNHDRVDENGKEMDSTGYDGGHPPSHSRETTEHVNKYGGYYGGF